MTGPHGIDDSMKRESWAGLDEAFLLKQNDDDDDDDSSDELEAVDDNSNSNDTGGSRGYKYHHKDHHDDDDDDDNDNDKVGYDEAELNNPADRRSSWGDLDSLLGQFQAALPASVRPNLESIAEGDNDYQVARSSKSLGRKTSRGSPKSMSSSTKSSSSSSIRSKNAELRRKISRSRSIGHGKA